MNICVIGTGYVGLITGTCFADMGNKVWCVDIDAQKIKKLKQGKIPIYEPGLQELVTKNMQEGRLEFTSAIKDGIKDALFCFIAVGTPTGIDGVADISAIQAVANKISINMDKYLIIVNKSTVPVGTASQIRNIIKEQLKARKREDLEFDIVSNPEFLKEGAAIEDFMHPDRIVIGTDNIRTAELMKQLYEPFVRNQNPILIMDITSAELTKYAANAMLATRISFMNEMARLCDQVGGDIAHVRLGIGTDRRIGMPFLYAGAGYGGSCFPKDVKAIINTGSENGVSMDIIAAVEKVNENQKYYLVEMLLKRFGEDLTGKKFGVWGLAFKPQTDDMREAPSIVIIRELLFRGATVTAYDPEAIEQAKKVFADCEQHIQYVDDSKKAIQNVDALIVITEWRQFRQPDLNELKCHMKSPIIFDGRNQYKPNIMKENGFEYYCIGRNCFVK
ncbi:UDP-glucose dehydrogenase family protein [Pelosinus propionicus]|uniref:UDP-glucose 6-dehydrogenase n=1 Tax=Pelosinus propionicus DSM 13327 TaxID=1123291 RepID=A0A1I4MQK7_9FIRM|nr:UDP-glucose/GDP-mannose dehydrogenase family protein [Pelosinus propionicus]SFM05326.1 UDPglucose 6-dehydrogenase [Pelosinus propionicus DSM 13327]